ncbi:MAG: response regulator, partial [Candidatus Binatia bacterium]
AARPGAEAGSGLRVLLVDDDDRVRQSCILMLRHLGHTVVSVSSGEEAVERILAERFDALLLDLHLGNGAIDGRDVLLEIEQRHSAILGRTLLATGDPTSGTVRELVRTLGVQVLAKPFGVEELRAALASLR